MEFWTNLVISLAAIISINISMYLYQNCIQCMWFNPFQKYRPSLFLYTEVFHIEGCNLCSHFKYMYAKLEKSKLLHFHFTKKPLLLTFHISTTNCEFSYQCNKAPFWVSRGFLKNSHLSSKHMLAECYINTCTLSNMNCSCIHMRYRDICIQTYWLVIAS